MRMTRLCVREMQKTGPASTPAFILQVRMKNCQSDESGGVREHSPGVVGVWGFPLHLRRYVMWCPATRCTPAIFHSPPRPSFLCVWWAAWGGGGNSISFIFLLWGWLCSPCPRLPDGLFLRICGFKKKNTLIHSCDFCPLPSVPKT